MKVYAIPTLAAGAAGGLSILFFLGLSDRFGDPMLAEIILVQAAVALVQIGLIPSSWVHLLGAGSSGDAVNRYRQGVSLELAGTLAGALVVALLAMLAGSRGDGALLMFLSLAVAASAATHGLFRVQERWTAYTLWVLLPNLVRVPLIWAAPWLVARGWLPEAHGDRALIILIFFLLPDLLRLLLLYLPLLLRHYRRPGVGRVNAGARQILKNWMYDMGSAATDQLDKLLVGTLLGPTVLVAYFFARRIGVVTVMVTEPYFSEVYRRKQAGVAPLTYAGIWRRGMQFAGALWAGLALAVVLVLQLPVVGAYVPDAVAMQMPLFLAIMLMDSLFAANRWSRYLAQTANRAPQLLAVRLSGLGAFALVLALTHPILPVWSVAGAMLAALMVDTLYVRRLALLAEMA